MATDSSILAGKIHGQRSPVGYSPWGHKESDMTERLSTAQHSVYIDFPGDSGKESTCNAVDPGSNPVSGRSAGEGIGYPLQCSWVSLVAQLVKNLSAMWETWVQSLSLEEPLKKGKATYSSILVWRIPQTV